MDDRFKTIFKGTAFKNHERFDQTGPLEKGKPNFSNTKINIEQTIEPGVYGVSVWQYSDSGNLSFELSKDTQPKDQSNVDGFK
tara:strand:- start:251 stop:499 length:249 start_codon:yes stop_codon:yes gene_type:complete